MVIGSMEMNGKMKVPKSHRAAERRLVGPRITEGYRPSIPAADFWSNEGVYLPIMFWDVERMLHHPAVTHPYSYYKAGIYNVRFTVNASSSKVGDFMMKEVRYFWDNYLDEVQKSYDYGWVGAEVDYEYKGQYLGVRSLEAFHPLDTWALTDGKKYKGVSVQMSSAAGSPLGVYTKGPRVHLWGDQKYPPKGFWYSHKNRFNRFYGRSQLYGGWRPWRRLAIEDAAEEVLDGGIYRMAYAGPEIRYPVKGYNDPDTGEYIDSRMRATEIGDNVKAGGNVMLPGTKDEQGDYEWQVNRPAHAFDPTGLLNYVSYLKKEISAGIDVPLELLESSDIGSGWSGRKIPLVAYYTMQLKNARRILRAWWEQIGSKLLLWNFGRGHHCSMEVVVVMPEGLAEGASPVIGTQPQAGGVPGQTAGDQNQALQDNPLASLMAPPEGKQMSLVGEDYLVIDSGNISTPPSLRSVEPSWLLSVVDDEPSSCPDPVVIADSLVEECMRALEPEVARVGDNVRKSLGEWSRGQSPVSAQHEAEQLAEPVMEVLAVAQVAGMLEGARSVASRVEVVGDRPIVPGTDDLERVMDFADPSRLGLIKEALSEVRQKGIVTGRTFQRMVEEARDNSNSIVGVAAGDLRDAIRDSLADVTDVTDAVDSAHGRIRSGTILNPARLRQVMHTAIAASVTRGQDRALEEPQVRDLFPYLAYRSREDTLTRPNHRAMEKRGIQGTNVYRRDDPVMKWFKPPWEWKCRCFTNPLTVRQAARLGIQEAQKWLESGIAPNRPAHVPMPEFLPQDGFNREAVMLSAVYELSWVRSGTSKAGRKRWTNDQGEIRYQDEEPGTRGEVAPPSDRPNVAAKLSKKEYEELKEVLDSAAARMKDPDHPLTRHSDSLHQGTFKGRPIRTLLPGKGTELSPEDHQKIASEHHAAARASKITGRDDLSESHRAARDYHRGLSGNLPLEEDAPEGAHDLHHHESINAVLGKLSEEARDYLSESVKEIRFKKGKDAFSVEDEDGDGAVTIRVSHSTPGSLQEVVAAALAHVLDGKEGSHSSSDEWQEAWEEHGGNISRGKGHREGFVEFARRALCPDCDERGVEGLLAYWRKHGILKEEKRG